MPTISLKKDKFAKYNTTKDKHMEPNLEPTQHSKDKEREQIQKDVESFLLSGGVIEELPPAEITKTNIANVKKSTE